MRTTQGWLKVPLSQNDHLRDALNAPLTLVEYADFQCEYCGSAFEVIRRVHRELGGELAFVFRHFPLSNQHPQALLAAQAAEAAGAQAMFWPMHDLLFTHQKELSTERVTQFARVLGLDLARFQRELEDAVYLQRVREDVREGVQSGVNSTPSLFVNGARFDEPVDYDRLMLALRRPYVAAA